MGRAEVLHDPRGGFVWTIPFKAVSVNDLRVS